MSEFAIITGAAGGLGKEFSFELAKRGFNAILIDLPNTGLPAICEKIKRQYKVETLYFESDLTRVENVVAVTDEINTKYPVSVLINNAGVGGTRRFEDANVNYLNTMIQLNVMATTIMTKQMLPNLQKRKEAFVLNVSSLAAFSPFPFKTVYPASKAFVHSFSRGLFEEYRKSNVFISVVNPGPIKTNPQVTARIDKQGRLGRIGLLSPKKVAEICIRQLFKRDAMIMLNKMAGLNWLLMKVIPIWIRLPLLSRVIRRELREEDEEKHVSTTALQQNT